MLSKVNSTDVKANKAEVKAIEQLKKENLQLRHALKKGTIELEHTKRELQIEASLEKVRRVAMSMKKPADMLSLCKTVAQQLKKLGVNEIRNVQTAIFYPDKGTYMNYEYYAKHKKPLITEVSYTNNKIHKAFASKMIKGKGEFFATHINGRKKLSEWVAYQKTTNVFIDKYLETASSLNYYWFSLGPVALGISTYHPLTEDDKELFKRSLNVFELAYRRYADIEKAEAQAREAQIQLALEKVRARTMAMHNSEELSEVATLLFKQVDELGIKTWTTGFNVWSDDNNFYTDFITSPQGGFIEPYTIDAREYTVFIAVSEAKKRGEEFYIHYEEGEMLRETYRQLSKFGEKQFKNMLDGGFQFPVHQYEHFVFGPKVSLMFITYEPVPEGHDIFKRFGKVFEQTYTRFLDLQKAEAQARESQIELGLERVRTRAMAMHKSDELGELVAILFDELTKLDLILARCIIWIFDGNTLAARMWMANSEDKRIAKSYFIKRIHHPYYNAILSGWKERKPKWLYDLKGDDKKTIDQVLLNETDLSQLPDAVKNGILTSKETFVSGSFNNFGLIEASGPVAYSDEQLEIVQRFGKVFDLSYTRFNDLQKAEAQAREAQIEAALERVRARAMAMHTSHELKDVALELRKQMGTIAQHDLEVCAIHLFDESPDYFESWAAVPVLEEKGKVIEVQARFPKRGLKIVDEMLAQYYAGTKDYILINEGAKVLEWFDQLKEKVPLGYELILKNLNGVPPEETRSYWSMSDFPGGSLVMTTFIPPNDEARQLLRRFANVFGMAYQRFVDLKKAEGHALQAEQDLAAIKAARKKAEDTLTELRATQKQLVQSEKMASLGELTAGIAHEIQNPLNFVNNFSEVNNELIEEVKNQKSKLKSEELDGLLNDIFQNNEKINHHGRRADAIVKGMLQHSRTSSGQKEPTDVNALCDEYLRLAYHGLRAKDKTFNAKFETDFDNSIGKINIIPQDIGRVILNLINNAFYAVTEKKKENIDGYEPAVTVTTTKSNAKVEIRVKDNGIGISQKVLDKIFQPFFTTKPTGQGTGLGLSLAYDIVKAHGGEISVDTAEGKGSSFIITIPATA